MTIDEERKDHWQKVWSTKQADEVSWFQPEPTLSMELIERQALRKDAGIIDIGGGASLLVDRLIERGWHHVAVLDISQAALDQAAERLGPAGDDVTWIEADILEWRPVPGLFELWHDRAVFHFLTRPEDQKAYRRILMTALVPGGTVILATFAPDGPEKCSGLPVARHDIESLARVLGADFELIETRREDHVTPSGKTQSFTWGVFRRV
ncbi:class I SAM-dependent methyltransferase [Magnetospirillum moscoviense]|uniref:SAM-dependent methyltransferase n=1 Tax=Magnetospirillum moscoviense TaxID=1437059 RepID=A0A178MST1_9PROT|nr:class I SAM-dependent methyltransferase [Magnetospirillum moscoviense]OAN52450.1 SAM-dependent methyltransferase [Magnetospirillum moscoviense]